LEDLIAPRWLKTFVYASSANFPGNAAVKKYNKTEKTSRGGIMYLFLTLCEMFQMSKEIKLAMISFIEYSKKKGIATYSGENVLIASKELLGVCKRLDAVSALTEEHFHDILTGLNIYNSNRFKSMFKLMADQADIGKQVFPTITAESTIMEAVKAALEKATDTYNFLCRTNKMEYGKERRG
jgi:hypothetical protein